MRSKKVGWGSIFLPVVFALSLAGPAQAQEEPLPPQSDKEFYALVYYDRNDDGVKQDNEPKAGAVTLQFTEAHDDGTSIQAPGLTDAEGTWYTTVEAPATWTLQVDGRTFSGRIERHHGATYQPVGLHTHTVFLPQVQR